MDTAVRLCHSYKQMFPDLDVKCKAGKFLAQFVEEIEAQSSVVHEGDGIMVTLDRYCDEMRKADYGAIDRSTAEADFKAKLKDPNCSQIRRMASSESACHKKTTLSSQTRWPGARRWSSRPAL